MKSKKTEKLKHGIYILIAAGMLFYAFSGVELTELEGIGGVFWFLWLAFAVVILAANANMLLLTQEKREALSHVKRAKWMHREQTIENFVNRRAKEEARRVRGR
jgi:heme exporter protein D